MSNKTLAISAKENGTQIEARNLCIQEKFEAQVERTPEGVAVSWENEALTYRELNSQANRLAHLLRANGVGPEIPVALYLDRKPKTVVAILAVLKAGGAYVPIDLAYPKERAAFMLEDAQAPILITEQKLRESVPAGNAKVICIDSDWETISGQSDTNPEVVTQSENIAYIIYTSGSTGKPKGVMVTHHNVVRLLEQTAHWYQFHAGDVWPLFHSYSFDVSVWELWGSLFNGGRLIVVPYLVTRSPSEFYELLAREEITVLNQTPSAFRQLIWAEANAQIKRKLNLRYVICAGEALELQSLKPWFDLHGDEQPKIVNMYGITETTVHSTYRVIRKKDLEDGSGSVIGVPIPDLQLYLVDEDLKPVPQGSPGEICVGGAGVARGYLKRPELTAKRFIPDPFSEEPNARLYRSGDLAQYSSNGELEYLGRMDHQVKIRGFRVELGEIESALNSHVTIRESVVIAQETANGDKRLVAYVVPVSDLPTVTELRDYLAMKVPGYMVPAVFMPLKSLPLTTNGKVDRRALPSPDGARPDLKAAFVAPATEAEKILAAIWNEVLEVETVGLNDNFFELGGDSIRSIRVLSRAQEKGLQFTLQEMFQNPTVAGLVACASRGVLRNQFERIQPYELISEQDRSKLPENLEDAYPVARLQLGMFFHNELNPESAVYHDVFTFNVQSKFDSQSLEQAIEDLVARHPILRTSFNLSDYSVPMQLVHKKAKVQFGVEDLRQNPEAEQVQLVKQWVEIEKRRAFDRKVAPLVRFHVQLRKDDEFSFIISFHHSCLDGWSLAAAITEIFESYRDRLAGKPGHIKPPGITYGDFVAHEGAAISSETTRQFWSEKIRDARAQLLPRWPENMREGGHEQKRGPELHIKTEVFEGLKKLAQSSGVPLKTVLLAAHQHVMRTLYGQNEVISGLISNGRPEEADGDKMLGLFLNAVPIRMNLAGGTWQQLVKETFAAEQEVIPHRRFPMAEIQKLNGGRPLFETAFDFVHFHVYKNLEGQQALDLAEGHYFEANDMTTYTTFMLDMSSTRLELHIDYNPNEICRTQVEQISNYYLATLEAMAINPAARYERYCPLSKNERDQILIEWNNTFEKETGVTIHALVEARAKEKPEAIAIVCGTERLSYGELNQKADKLAGHLREMEIGREAPVGICVDRSANMVVGLLAILKAGGAYMPMDPAYPKDRLAFMMEDAGAKVVVTDVDSRRAIPGTSAQIVEIEKALKEGSSNGHAGREATAAQNSPSTAYVIYTSGSTGKPKGVQVLHRGVVNLLQSAAKKIGASSEDTLLAVTTLSFDIAALELFMPLVIGAQLHIASREAASDGSQLAALIKTSGATLMQATPATWRLLIEAGWDGDRGLKIICGGEALPRHLADQLVTRNKEVWNFYGPTETTIWSSAWKVEKVGPIVIGRPLANTQFYVLSGELQPLPIGTGGELYIGGSGLAAGYLNRPELTAERFIQSPYFNGRIYRTGDIARFLPDGTVECLGRVDAQVKIRGFRIEPGEIEAVLRKHPEIADVLVTARADAFGDQRLVAYVIGRNGELSLNTMRDFARSQLPHYMVPAQFVALKEFPLTPNLKIDVRRLPTPEHAQASRGDLRAARNPEEQAIVEIWKEALMLREVGIDESFFDLGGDSLAATRAFARMNKLFHAELSLGDMFDYPTIASLAALIHSRREKPSVKSAIPRLPRRTAALQTPQIKS